MRKLILSLIIAAFCINDSNAQALCGFDQAHTQMMTLDPDYARKVNENNAYIKQYVEANPLPERRGAAALYTIPVVVHVVHTGGAIGSIYNPTDAQVQGAIDYLNAIYNGTHSSLSGGVGDMQIQFALAKRDPNCNPTTGINHVDGSSIPNYTANGVNRNTSSGATEISVKNFIRWDPTKYYNIWVINKIDGADGTSGTFIAGFAYFPGASANNDGTMMLATQMKSGEKTLPHEIGHALNLYHTFQGSSNSTTCPANNNCSTDGDMVCDTDPVTYTTDFVCRTGTNSCTGTSFSINTESNFMGYTNCYTLFTAGQSSRALAAMSLSSRSSLANSLGATPTYSGSTQCPPYLNFEATSFTATEQTTSTVDCRKYKDYTVNLTIGNMPSANTTVTLVTSGSAVNMVDYQITTNGSFTSPSSQLTFPTGSYASKPFTIRVFDNAIIDGSRTLTITQSVNANGGNAAIGTGIPSYTLTIGDNDVAPQPYSTVSATIGTNSNGGFYQPFRCNYSKAKTQALYLASELQAQGLTAGASITSIGFVVTSKSSSTPYNGLSIGLKKTTSTGLSTSAFETGVDNYYTGNYSTTVGANTITLSSPFIWDGTSNVVVEMCYTNSVNAASNDNINSTLQATSMCTWNRDVSGTGCALAPAYNSISGVGFVRPDFIFTAQSGNNVASTLSTSGSEYLGPFGDVYFKSGTDIIARVTNLTGFDYGCTSIAIDRSGTGSSNFWNNTTANNVTNKTYLITPTNSNINGQYEVTLYYQAGEKNGYELSTFNPWANLKMIKTPLTVGSTNSSNTSFWNVKVSPITAGSFGSDFTAKGSFTGPMGGFTVGNPLTIFPLQWLSFIGKLTTDLNAQLQWQTANEINNDRFEVEESINGTEFRKIGSVKSQGNGGFGYSFIDIKPASGNHYYRIKQVDKDGKYSYSNVIILTINSRYNIVVYPIPAKETLTVKFGSAVEDASIEILSTDLKLIRKENIIGFSVDRTINVSTLASGIYVAKITIGSDVQMIRFVKQ